MATGVVAMTASAHRAVQRDLPPRRVTRLDPTRQFAEDTLPNGSLVVSAELCAAFGGGDEVEGRRELRAMLLALRERKLREPPVARPAVVRIASTREDEDAAVALWKIDVAENAAHVAPMDEDRLRAHIRAGVDRQGGIVGLIDGPDGPVALSVLIASQWHWSNQWYWQDLCSFVHPDHRRSRHVHALLDFNEWCTDEMSRLFGYQIRLLTGVLGTRRLWAKTALFRRRYQPVGSSFIYPPITAAGG